MGFINFLIAKGSSVEDTAGEQVRFVIVFITDDAEPKRELLTVFDKIEVVLAVDPLATGRCQGGELFFRGCKAHGVLQVCEPPLQGLAPPDKSNSLPLDHHAFGA